MSNINNSWAFKNNENNETDEKNKIYYEKTWGGDHHGTTQSLINMVVLDFSK